MKKFTTSQRLKQVMNERNLRQVDILNASKPYCTQYGVMLGRSALSQYVSGRVEPGQEKLTVLAKALDVSESWLLGYDVPQEDTAKSKTSIVAEESGVYETKTLAAHHDDVYWTNEEQEELRKFKEYLLSKRELK